MSEQANDFLRDYQAFAQQSWDAWTRQFQAQGGEAGTSNPFVAPAADDAATTGAAPLQPILDGLAAYADWLRQGLESVSGAAAERDWRAQLEQWLAVPPSTAGGHGAADPGAWWQSLVGGAMGPAGASGESVPPWFPSFGHGRERQARQQELLRASLDCAEAGKPYQAMLLRAHADGVALLRERLAGGELKLANDDIKGLYTAWVEAAEQAYAAISMTAEFRTAYADTVNAQMRLHKLQRQQVEETCREFGMPTRAEFDELAQRMHELRRAWRADMAGQAATASTQSATPPTEVRPAATVPANAVGDDEIDHLRQQIKQRHDGNRAGVAAASTRKSAKPAATKGVDAKAAVKGKVERKSATAAKPANVAAKTAKVAAAKTTATSPTRASRSTAAAAAPSKSPKRR